MSRLLLVMIGQVESCSHTTIIVRKYLLGDGVTATRLLFSDQATCLTDIDSRLVIQHMGIIVHHLIRALLVGVL